MLVKKNYKLWSINATCVKQSQHMSKSNCFYLTVFLVRTNLFIKNHKINCKVINQVYLKTAKKPKLSVYSLDLCGVKLKFNLQSLL